ncbi:hypothetical protein DFQ28_001174 [Apophysomyces sp. BC1034]|nr:hypothetical protein DFQ28_001174 [Apophysomyces sp. BC1034]
MQNRRQRFIVYIVAFILFLLLLSPFTSTPHIAFEAETAIGRDYPINTASWSPQVMDGSDTNQQSAYTADMFTLDALAVNHLKPIAAVLLHTSDDKKGIIRTVQHLLKYPFIKEIIIQDNSKTRPLTLEQLDLDPTATSRVNIEISQSEDDLGSFARFTACALSSYDHCYFQDDLWYNVYLDTMYTNFLRNPDLVHSMTDPIQYPKYLRWQFSNKACHREKKKANVCIKNDAVKRLQSKLESDTSSTPKDYFNRDEDLPLLTDRVTRASCANDKCLFITNINPFPDPTLIHFDKSIITSIQKHETLYDELNAPTAESWVSRGFHNAVDKSTQTCWNTYQNPKVGDYFGLILVGSMKVKHLVIHGNKEIRNPDRVFEVSVKEHGGLCGEMKTGIVFFVSSIMRSSSQRSITSGGDISLTTTPTICFVTGMAVVFMGYSVYSHLKTLQDRNANPGRRKRETGKGNRTALLAAGALGVLVEALKCTDPEMDESTKRFVAVAICDLIQGSDINKYCIIELGVLDPIKRILTSTTIRNNELKYWTLMILYQISLSDPMPKILILSGFVSLLAKMARMTYGNTNMPKFCMQSLVRIVASVDVIEAKRILTELLDYHIVELISICLRGDDVELIYWAAGLMHEFVLKDVAADKFRDIKGVHTILASLLSADEMYIARVVLRTVKFMAYGQETFRQEMVHTGMVKRIMHCLTLDDDDVRYWATLCIHAVAGQVESHEDILCSSEFELLLSLATSVKVHVSIFIADILSLICCIPSNNVAMECHVDTIISTLNSLITLDELEVQYNAAGAIFNLMVMRDQPVTTRITLQVIDPLINSCVEMSHNILPIIMMQSLITAKKGEFLTTKDTGSRDVNYNASLESDGVFTPDYINVNTAGTISNAMRLEEILHNSSRFNRSPTEAGYTDNVTDETIESMNNLRHNEVTNFPDAQTNGEQPIACDPLPSDVDRTSLFMEFELPLSSRVQFVGALSALRILLENSDIAGDVISGTVFESLMESMAQMEGLIDKEGENMYDKEKQRSYKLSDIKVRTCCSKFGRSKTTSPLPDTIRQFAESLLLLALYPVLDTWATSSCKDIDLDQMHPGAIKLVYYDFLQWIHASTMIDVQNLPAKPSRTSQSTMHVFDRLSSDNELNEQREKYRILRKVESAAERLGETRRGGEDSPVDDAASEGQSSHLTKMYSGFATRALMVLRSLVRYEPVRDFLVQKMNFVEVMIHLLQNNRSVSDYVLACLGVLVNSDPCYVVPETSLQALVVTIWHDIQLPMLQKQSFHFFARIIMTYASRIIAERTEEECRNSGDFVEIDLVRRSKLCLVNYETSREFRNDSWTFETAKSTYSTPVYESWGEHENHKYAFEVVLATDGLMQVGWVNDNFEIDPEGGTGVGDDGESYGYDGYRAKKWHGRHSIARSSYGSEWTSNDVITSTLDLVRGEIKYYKNGTDMGVAFTGVPNDRSWYPAMSISTGQGCEFRFGGPLDKLRYLPDGYMPMASLVRSSAIEDKSSLPHIISENEPSQLNVESSTDEPEVDDLTDALRRMSMTTPDTENMLESGNNEPNLKPIDIQDLGEYPSNVEDVLPVHQAHDEDEVVLPSLYFEASVVYQQKELDLRCAVLFSAGARTPSIALEINNGDILGMTLLGDWNV